MKPLSECPVSAVLIGDPPEQLSVSDVSVGGIAFVTEGSLKLATVGQRISLRLTLAHYGEHVVTADVRWVDEEALTGARFVDLSPEATKAVRRYVAELLERGAGS